MDALILEVLLGFGVGLLLGLMGGGGSILTVPALVYLIGQSPQAAVTASLVIVGTNSAFGAWFHRQHGTLNLRVALLFGGSGMAAAFIMAGVSKRFPPDLLMVAFASLMLLVGGMMLRRRGGASDTIAHPHGTAGIMLAGVGVGALTGLLGVGGGFLIVPALVMWVGLPIREAVGTSLVIIAANSLAGFLGHLGGATLDMQVVLAFALAGVLGTLTGVQLAQRIRPAALQRAFAVMVVILAVALLADNLSKLVA
jgi:uncharacterized membrane protein YfcA